MVVMVKVAMEMVPDNRGHFLSEPLKCLFAHNIANYLN